MLFSSPLFIFLFLPIVLLIYALLPNKLRIRNAWLLAASFVFYAWGETGFVVILILSALLNFCVGIAVERSKTPLSRKCIAATGITLNLALLGFFKYFNFGVNTLNVVLQSFGSRTIGAANLLLLPLGISFFTFHALSYLIDVYRKERPAATNPADVALYIFFFPQLIAGPILRWHAIAPQLADREHTVEKFAEGVRRFILGLAKKVLIANTVALPADKIFSLPASQLSAADAWLGIVCYTLQIYFDFSGYSDMAVGMGKMFGFSFIENFHFPYISRSIREFWHRWHISLSTWFRDYLYFPLGGNRGSNARTCLNLVIVFFLCGLWHGASLTFIVWGLYHGLFLILERTSIGSAIERMPRILRHSYVLLVVMIGWVIFRADNFGVAANYLYAMSGLGCAPQAEPWQRYADGQVICVILLGIIWSTPVWGNLKAGLERMNAKRPAAFAMGSTFEMLGIVMLFSLSVVWMAGETYRPFIYFRF